MYILKIIPIASGMPENYFSYLYHDHLEVGALVEITIGKRNIFGIVSNSESVLENKINIRKNDFVLKKIERVIKSNFLTSQFLSDLIRTSELLGTRAGYLLDTYLPKFLLDNLESLNLENEIRERDESTTYQIAPLSKRLDFYLKKSHANVVENKSTVIFFPTINDLLSTLRIFENNFQPEHLLSLHSELTKKEITKVLDQVNTKLPKIILSTPNLFPFLMPKAETMILAEENSLNYYTTGNSISLDFREIFQELTRGEKIVSGSLLSLASFNRAENSLIYEQNKPNWQILDRAKENDLSKEEIENRVKLVDDEKFKKYNSIYFSPTLKHELEKLKDSSAHGFLFVKRKGLYTQTLCLDCGATYKCQNCATPYILIEKDKAKKFVCPKCHSQIELTSKSHLLCQTCASWRMETFGIGVDGVAKSLQDLGFKIFKVDTDNTKTKKKITDTLAKWQSTHGSILVGTDLALNYLNSNYQCELGAIISLDSLFQIPDFRIDEEIFNLVLEMRGKINSQGEILIQTRLAEEPIWKHIEKNNRLEFLQNELQTRRELHLPPETKILYLRIVKRDAELKSKIQSVLNRIAKEENQNLGEIRWQFDPRSKSYLGTLTIQTNLWQKLDIDTQKLYPTPLAHKLTTLLLDFHLEINGKNL